MFLVVVSAQILILYVSLVHGFALPRIFLCKMLRFSYILQDFLFVIGIWFWAVGHFGSNYHASVVRG